MTVIHRMELVYGIRQKGGEEDCMKKQGVMRGVKKESAELITIK